MAYIGNQTGGDDDQRRAEAERLLEIIGDDLDGLSSDARKFVMETKERFAEYGPRTIVTGKQIFYLRDIKDRMI